jgi:hypothetical protein
MWKLKKNIKLHLERNVAFVYDSETHKMYEINETGSFLLKLLDKFKCCNTCTLVKRSLMKYIGNKKEIEKDIIKFLRFLKRNKVVEEIQ